MTISHKDYQNYHEIKKKDLLELLYFPLAFIAFFVLEFKIVPQMEASYHPAASRIELIIFLLIFGLTHIFARNMLSYLYNMNKIILPIAPKATPKINVIIGTACIIVSIIGSLTLV